MITQQDLIDRGFEKERKKVMTTEGFRETGNWIHKGFKPHPLVEAGFVPFIGRIGSIQITLRDVAMLDRFINNTVPVYCEPTY